MFHTFSWMLDAEEKAELCLSRCLHEICMILCNAQWLHLTRTFNRSSYFYSRNYGLMNFYCWRYWLEISIKDCVRFSNHSQEWSLLSTIPLENEISRLWERVRNSSDSQKNFIKYSRGCIEYDGNLGSRAEWQVCCPPGSLFLFFSYSSSFFFCLSFSFPFALLSRPSLSSSLSPLPFSLFLRLSRCAKRKR